VAISSRIAVLSDAASMKNSDIYSKTVSNLIQKDLIIELKLKILFETRVENPSFFSHIP
jgi:hypothetical protein